MIISEKKQLSTVLLSTARYKKKTISYFLSYRIIISLSLYKCKKFASILLFFVCVVLLFLLSYFLPAHETHRTANDERLTVMPTSRLAN